ncbi:gamma taxilin [Echinococcus multilocularis]|uniref:Gamma taxilin n=1 Tax=Echinococcus multilocularis TaxID=6211 RepID=A0A068YNW0_ECHMU|nr:gamma taxilin [Echinococcus multilocularis]
MATEGPVAEIIEEKQKQEEEKQKNVLGLTKKQRKRELKFIAGELRTLPEDASDEDKLIALYRKFQILNSENSEMSSKLKLTDKRILSVAAERDQYLDSFNRANIQREKLEALCRELQKQNHLIRDQSLAMAQSEDEKRKEVADRFQSGINEIQTQLNDYLEKNNKLREENQMLADKLQKFIADHEKRENYVQKLLKTRELEAKLAEAKAVQAQAVQEQAVLREKRETERALEECSLLKQRLEAHQLVEEKLKEQIEFYKNKYQSFNKTMAKSNDLIENTKKEMQKMTKHVRTAESAALEWRSKWEVSQKALLDMIDECRKEKERSQALQKQVDSLSNLCRALRAGKSSPPKEEEAQPRAEKDADGDENKKGEEKSDEKS